MNDTGLFDPEINSAVMILKSELSLNYESEVIIILEDYDFMGKRITKEY
jgi:5S rRNA maturation endonuclease (ribonuclease M5)